MERKERDGSSSSGRTKSHSKHRELLELRREMSPGGGSSYNNFAKDKENSEPMELGSPPAGALSPQMNIEEEIVVETDLLSPSQSGAANTTESSAAAKQPGAPLNSSSSASADFKQKNGVGIEAGRSAVGSPQSLSQIMNLPSSAFSFDLSEFQSPSGSGFLSPVSSAKLGKKRPLSISPLSSSSVNIDALVRGSPTSLLNFITQSRCSSAGSFGHLSPSLYTGTTSRHTGFNRPSISLSKAVHPSSLLPNSNPATTISGGGGNGGGFITSGPDDVDDLECNKVLSQQAPDRMPTMNSELADIADTDASIQPMLRASLEQESEGELSLPAEPTQSSTYSESASESDHKMYRNGGGGGGGRRIYYAYPAVEEPHNNCCMWEGCQQQCETLDHLVTHVNNDHIYQESRKDFICRWTGCVRERRPFKAQYMLLVHMRRHTGEKPHKCHYEGCDKAYSRLENLKTHLRSHTGEKPYLCKYESCGKAFSNASDCAKHMNRTHSDEKPYACLNPGCMKRYTDPSSRRKHMKNCQVNKKARTGVTDFISEGDDMDTARPPSLPPPSSDFTCFVPSTVKSPAQQTGKKPSKSKKSDKKQRNTKSEDTSKNNHGLLEFPNSSIDMGYMSGGSQCTPAMGLMGLLKSGRTQLSGYSSSGYYETEYTSLQEDTLPLVLSSSLSDHHSLEGPYYEASIKREPFSPSSSSCSQMDHFSPYQLSQAQPPPPYFKHGLHPLPELQAFGSGGSFQGFSSQSSGGGGVEVGSSGYSSFGGSPVRMMNSDETCSLGGSYRSGGGGSELGSSSHSSFSTLSSHLSSPISHHNGGGGRDYSKHSYRNLRPPDLILRPHQPTYSVQMSDIKVSGGGYRCHSDEVSLRSSHSSRYSGSEYSDDLSHRHGNIGHPPPLPPPEARSSSREPLPLPHSMQAPGHEYMTSQPDMTSMRTDSQFTGKGGVYQPYSVGSLPLKHYDQPPIHQQGKHGLPIIFESQVHAGIANNCPNMVIGNMALNASQLHQDNIMFENLSTSSSYIGLPH